MAIKIIIELLKHKLLSENTVDVGKGFKKDFGISDGILCSEGYHAYIIGIQTKPGYKTYIPICTTITSRLGAGSIWLLHGHYGELLIKLMEKHNARNLQEITAQQAKEFYLGLMAAA